MVYVLSIASAIAFAFASLLQLAATKDRSDTLNMRPGLLFSLFKHGGWLGGIALDVLAVTLQILALAFGKVAVVQAILSLGLVVSIACAPYFGFNKPSSRISLLSLAAGFGVGIYILLQPTQTKDSYRMSIVLIVAAFVAMVAVIPHFLLKGASRHYRAMSLSIVASVLVGLASVLERILGLRVVALGIFKGAFAPNTLMLIALGLEALLITQSAFQLGELQVVLPIIAIGEPMVSFVFARILLGERLWAPGVMGLVAFVAIVGSLSSVYVLGRQAMSELSGLGPAEGEDAEGT